jgi:hypothetical protein
LDEKADSKICREASHVHQENSRKNSRLLSIGKAGQSSTDGQHGLFGLVSPLPCGVVSLKPRFHPIT